jgi:hypothetical protein
MVHTGSWASTACRRGGRAGASPSQSTPRPPSSRCERRRLLLAALLPAAAAVHNHHLSAVCHWILLFCLIFSPLHFTLCRWRCSSPLLGPAPPRSFAACTAWSSSAPSTVRPSYGHTGTSTDWQRDITVGRDRLQEHSLSASPNQAGLVEGQQIKFYAEPVNVLAGRLGLPQWLVDLRHEATHSQVKGGAGRHAGTRAGGGMGADHSRPGSPLTPPPPPPPFDSCRRFRACAWERSSSWTGSSGSTGRSR